MQDEKKDIVFFDGVCNLCNGFIDFVIRRNKKKNLYYASLQSDYAMKLLAEKKIDISKLSTIYFYSGGKMYSKSGAVLRIAKNLSGFYPSVASALLLLNSRFRDFFYDKVAANRYKLWGRKDTCRLPTPDERKMFLL